jgi:hypothetical protein
MIYTGRRNRVETNALLLGQARWLLDRAHLRLNLLVDIRGAHKINRIINGVESERQRWLRAVDSPLP